MINVILGGATSGDSNEARKVHCRQLESFTILINHRMEEDPIISFGPVDLEGVTIPHEDALVINTTIANYDVARMFVDSGSSVNILF